MKIIIAGSRGFTDYALFNKLMTRMTLMMREVIVVTGDAKGADALARRWAYESGHTYEVWRAEWEKHGKAAGILRNEEMIKDSGGKILIAWWDGRSSGTRDAITRARKHGLKVKIIYYKDR